MFSTPSSSFPQLHRIRDAASGLDGVIALDGAGPRPAIGGCRMLDAVGADREAPERLAARLAALSARRNLLAGLPAGGGAALLFRPAGAFDRAELFRAFGRAVAALGGRFHPAPDLGVSTADMMLAAAAAPFGTEPAVDGAGMDPAAATARGVFVAMRHAAARRLGRPLRDCTVAIQGAGRTGTALALLLRDAGARLVVGDSDTEAAMRLAFATGAQVSSARGVLLCRADILAPCAGPDAIDVETVSRTAARVVCGAADAPLASAAAASLMAARGVVFAPDRVVTAGGAIALVGARLGWTRAEVERRVDDTAARLAAVLDEAETRGGDTAAATLPRLPPGSGTGTGGGAKSGAGTRPVVVRAA